MNWIFWTVPQEHIRRYLVWMVLIMFFVPNYIFGIYYTITGFLVNLIWYDLIFYGWVKMKDRLEGMDE